jgi:ADP-ribose pyrophosphatase YjhB (NUDIX family)
VRGVAGRGSRATAGPVPVKESVALLIEPPDAAGSATWLLVRRPPDDDELAGVWGLPAGSLRPGETLETLVRRVGLDKLGVELRPGATLAEGDRDRPGYRLRMRLCAAELVVGEPAVPQPTPGVTQYCDWVWGTARALVPGAAAGSLCCALALELAREGTAEFDG